MALVITIPNPTVKKGDLLTVNYTGAGVAGASLVVYVDDIFQYPVIISTGDSGSFGYDTTNTSYGSHTFHLHSLSSLENSNYVSFTVQTVVPNITIDNTTYIQGVRCQVTGTGFTPNGDVYFGITVDNGVTVYGEDQGNADADGSKNGSFLIGTNIPPGKQKVAGIDQTTGAYSNYIQVTVKTPPIPPPPPSGGNPTCKVIITPSSGSTVTITADGSGNYQDIISCVTRKILTSMIGDFTLTIANSGEKYTPSMFPLWSEVAIYFNGQTAYPWTGHITAVEPIYDSEAGITLVIRGKDWGEIFINDDVYQAWVNRYYTDIAAEVVDIIGAPYGITRNIVSTTDIANKPVFYPAKRDAFSVIMDLAGKTISPSNLPYDFFMDGKQLTLFPRGSKPLAVTHAVSWGTGGSTGNLRKFGYTNDITKLKNDIWKRGGSLIYPSYGTVANQSPASRPVEFEITDTTSATSISNVGLRRSRQITPSEKDSSWLIRLVANEFEISDRVEQRISCTVEGDPKYQPADNITISSPYTNINGTYYVYEVTQNYDSRTPLYITEFSLGTDILKFSSALARMKTDFDAKIRESKLNPKQFNWKRTGVLINTEPFVQNPQYSLQQYDYISYVDIQFCDLMTAPKMIIVNDGLACTSDVALDRTNYISVAIAQSFELQAPTNRLVISVQLKIDGTPAYPLKWALYPMTGDTISIDPITLGTFWVTATNYAWVGIVIDDPTLSSYGTKFALALWEDGPAELIATGHYYWHQQTAGPDAPLSNPYICYWASRPTSGSAPSSWTRACDLQHATLNLCKQMALNFDAPQSLSSIDFGLKVQGPDPNDTTQYVVDLNGLVSIPINWLADRTGQVKFNVVVTGTQLVTFAYSANYTYIPF